MKEEKIDRIIRKIFNDQFVEKPSADFTEQVMTRMGVERKPSEVTTKPMKQRRGLILMGMAYVVIFSLVFLIPGSGESLGAYQLPKIKIPSLGDYLNLGAGYYRLLIALILGGWILIFMDGFVRKLFMR